MLFKKNVLIVILSFVALSACKKEDKATPQPVDELTKLPAISATGAGTFGALVRGKAFVGKNVACAYTRLVSFPNSYVLLMTSTAADNSQIRFSLQVIHKLEAKTTFTLNNLSSGFIWAGQYIEGPNPADIYNTNIDVNGTLTVETLDEERKIMSGTFAFKGTNSEGKIVSITDGRYDTHYTYSEQ